MDCNEARTLLLDRRRGTLVAGEAAPVDAHLAECDACRHEDARDRELSAALDRCLPKRRAPASLARSVAARWEPEKPGKRHAASMRPMRTFAAIAACAAIAALLVLVWRSRSTGPDAMTIEAVNDHLRVLYSEHPLDVESGGMHQVKPWFAGRLDFAPVVAFMGDDEFPLQGGTVAYFLDRKAAAYVFKRRLHVITLFVFRADGLPWATTGLRSLRSARAAAETSRGFHALLWQKGDLGYALVSDVDARELDALGAKIAGAE